jgi:uncharacterized radical SAM superfamily Fe-S cluster-containing enzyme
MMEELKIVSRSEYCVDEVLGSVDSDFIELLSGFKEENLEQKLDEIAIKIKELKFENLVSAEKIKKINARRKINESKIEKLKTFLKFVLKALEREEIDTKNYRIIRFKQLTKLKIGDEEGFKNWIETHSLEANDFLKFDDPKVVKTKLKKALSEGREIPFCELVGTEVLRFSSVKAKDEGENVG